MSNMYYSLDIKCNMLLLIETILIIMWEAYSQDSKIYKAVCLIQLLSTLTSVEASATQNRLSPRMQQKVQSQWVSPSSLQDGTAFSSSHFYSKACPDLFPGGTFQLQLK